MTGGQAGFETSANALGWVLYCISQHPEVQAKLDVELEGAGLLTGCSQAPRPLAWDDLPALTYLDAVIKVTCLPVVPLSVLALFGLARVFESTLQ